MDTKILECLLAEKAPVVKYLSHIEPNKLTYLAQCDSMWHDFIYN